MYKIKKNSLLTTITLRGHYLTKKITPKTSKQTMVFLRSPKHFNIGKHKVHSFLNFKKITYNVFYNIPSFYFIANKLAFFKIFNSFHKYNLLYSLTSIKFKTNQKIHW